MENDSNLPTKKNESIFTRIYNYIKKILNKKDSVQIEEEKSNTEEILKESEETNIMEIKEKYKEQKEEIFKAQPQTELKNNEEKIKIAQVQDNLQKLSDEYSKKIKENEKKFEYIKASINQS